MEFLYRNGFIAIWIRSIQVILRSDSVGAANDLIRVREICVSRLPSPNHSINVNLNSPFGENALMS